MRLPIDTEDSAVSRRDESDDGEPPVLDRAARSIARKTSKRTVYISGQIPMAPDGSVPESFYDQARLTWTNVREQLAAADMTLDDIVRLAVILCDERHRTLEEDIRLGTMGERDVEVTVVIDRPCNERWLLEMEAVAAG